MFTNDLILFGKANEFQIKTMIKYLNVFCDLLRQKVNHEKSNLFFSRNVKNEIRRKIAKVNGFSITTNLKMYLGILIIHKRVSKHMFHHVIKKVQDKLAG